MALSTTPTLVRLHRQAQDAIDALSTHAQTLQARIEGGREAEKIEITREDINEILVDLENIRLYGGPTLKYAANIQNIIRQYGV